MTSDPGPPTRSRVRRRRKQARAEELRDAALALFVEKGFEATRTEEIAARAGVSKGTLYLYYPSKEKLLEAAIASPALSALDPARPTAQGDGLSAEVLRRMLSGIWAHLQREAVAGVLKLAIDESRRFPQIVEVWLRGVVSPAHASIVEVVVRGMDRGEFQKMDPGVAAHSLLLPMVLCCLHRHVIDTGTHDRCPDEAFIPQHVELVLRGLCRDPQTSSRGRPDALSSVAPARAVASPHFMATLSQASGASGDRPCEGR